MRCVRVSVMETSWLADIDDDWDSMTEEQRHDYIWEVAMDNGKVSFEFGAPIEYATQDR